MRAAREAAAAVAAGLAGDCGERVLVLGTEELMYAPTLIALELAEQVPHVRVSSTTRSPVLVVDEPDYPIRSALTFPSFDPAADGPGPRFAYNVGRRVHRRGARRRQRRGHGRRCNPVWSTDCAATPTGCMSSSLPTYRPLPEPLRGPDFGSYRPDEVAWLLTDLSAVPLEAPTEEREEAIQSGGAHYAESLPVEYQPDADYQQLFEQALDEAAARVAHAVGVVTELVLAERGRVAGAGLARPGRDAGRRAHAQVGAVRPRPATLPHYAVSIVRGRGIDEQALR